MEERQTAESPVNIRIKPEHRNIIDQARKIVGKNRSEFMLEASVHRAEDILLEHRLHLAPNSKNLEPREHPHHPHN